LFDNPVVIWDEPLDRHTQWKSFLEKLAAEYDEVRDVVPPRPRPEDICLTEKEFQEIVQGLPQVYLKELALGRGAESGEQGEGLPPSALVQGPRTTAEILRFDQNSGPDPLTRPTPAGENAGPSPPRGRGTPMALAPETGHVNPEP
jgi:hypothetical protein